MTGLTRNISIMAVAAIMPATIALAGQQFDRIAITPQSANAAIIIKSSSLPVPPTYRTAYRLLFQTYDSTAQQMLGSMLSGSLLIAAAPRLFAGNYLIADIKPGTYALTSFSRQDFWTLCYQNASIQFTIKPGEVLYLGEFDAQSALRDLTAKAIASGRTSTKGTPVDFFDAVPPPSFSSVSASDLAEATAAARQFMPKTTVAPTIGQLSPAR